MPGQVNEIVKKKRMNALMNEQQTISKEIQQKFLGRTLKVLIDEKQKNEKNVYLGRTEYDAPEVDGLVYVHSKQPLHPGDFVEVKITDTYEYDLAGEAL
jgi:ribosomal protein S12 methylthiotransferase